MASDSLRQVGQSLGKTGRDADRALKKVFPIKPRLERVRDVFDSTVQFEMEFVKEDNDKRVLLDLFFNLPPPLRGCKIGCIYTRCEEFDFEAGGNHYVTLEHPYNAGSVSVYLNGDKLPDTDVVESSPESGEVFYQTSSSGPDIVVFCYIYDTCGLPGLCPQFKPSFTGGTLLFSDKFDRPEGIETWGGLGYYYSGGYPTTPISVPIGTIAPNTLALDASRYYTFEDIRATGIVSEMILAFDAREWVNIPDTFAQHASTLVLFMNTTQETSPVTTPSLTIKVDGSVTLIRHIRYLTTPYVFNLGDTWQILSLSQRLYTTLDLRQELFIRFYFDGDIYRVKIWPQDQDEPVDWLEFDMALPSPTALRDIINASIFPPQSFTTSNIQWIKPDIWGGQMSTFGGADGFPVPLKSNGVLQAIEHWAGQVSGVYGSWEYSGFNQSATWSRHVAHSYAGFFWDDDVESDTIVNGTTNGRMRVGYPTCAVTAGWSSFDPYGPVEPIFVDQLIPAWDTYYGKTLDIKITGEVQWTRWRETLATPPLTILLQTFNYGLNGPPGTAGDYFSGTTQVSILANFEEWYPFELVIPATADGWIQWGCRFQESPKTIAEGLAGYTGSFFFTSTSTASINFRKVWTEAVTKPIGGAKPFCPEEV